MLGYKNAAQAFQSQALHCKSDGEYKLHGRAAK
jgi:hypothetical protein